MTNEKDMGKKQTPEKRNLPPKGTAARALHACGLWSDMSREEIERIKHDIFSSRRSRGSIPRTND